MALPTTPRERLSELLDLAQIYRGWSRKTLATELGRDASNIVPDSGIPKLDLVVELSRVLDWPVEDVVNALGAKSAPTEPTTKNMGFEELERVALDAHASGDYQTMIALARDAFLAAKNPDERVRACIREFGGHDGLGHYRAALVAAQRGLREPDTGQMWQLLLRSNLANAYYSLWQLFEAKGIAGDVVSAFAATPPNTGAEKVALAMSHYVRGNCYRRLMEPGRRDLLPSAKQANADLLLSEQMFNGLAEEYGHGSYRGIANTCIGARMEADVVLGNLSASDAVGKVVEALGVLQTTEGNIVGDWLESYGWWCVFGCNIALRHLEDPRDLQQKMAIFTNKADEIAQELGNWALRERVFALEYARRQRFHEWTGLESDWTLDSDDLRVMAGTMGRFPSFHQTGWQILRQAKVVRDN